MNILHAIFLPLPEVAVWSWTPQNVHSHTALLHLLTSHCRCPQSSIHCKKSKTVSERANVHPILHYIHTNL